MNTTNAHTHSSDSVQIQNEFLASVVIISAVISFNCDFAGGYGPHFSFPLWQTFSRKLAEIYFTTGQCYSSAEFQQTTMQREREREMGFDQHQHVDFSTQGRRRRAKLSGVLLEECMKQRRNLSFLLHIIVHLFICLSLSPGTTLPRLQQWEDLEPRDQI